LPSLDHKAGNELDGVIGCGRYQLILQAKKLALKRRSTFPEANDYKIAVAKFPRGALRRCPIVLEPYVYRNGSRVDTLMWVLIAIVIAAMGTIAVVTLVRSIRRENRRINKLIANADDIIAADREAEIDEDGFRSA
jgi:hypothetical protein